MISFRYDPIPSDRDTIRQLTDSTGVFYPVEIEIAVELIDERLAKGPASGYEFAFAEQNGRPVGYTCYGPIALTAASYDLFWIAVDKACQGLGVGKRLMAESERLIHERGGRRVYIETSGRAIYEPTRAFYLRCGYTLEALLKDFYAPGDDKAIFVKEV